MGGPLDETRVDEACVLTHALSSRYDKFVSTSIASRMTRSIHKGEKHMSHRLRSLMFVLAAELLLAGVEPVHATDASCSAYSDRVECNLLVENVHLYRPGEQVRQAHQ